MKNILIISLSQYGYDNYYFYPKYLRDKYSVDFWCINQNKTKIYYPGNKITYFNKPNGRIKLICLMVRIGTLLRRCNYDYILHRYHRLSFLIRLISRKASIYDIRSVAVSRNPLKRFMDNSMYKFNSLFFENIFTISPKIAEALKIPPRKRYIIPLGADIEVVRNHDHMKDINMLYVGTLDGRNIHETIKGLSIFCKKIPQESINYTIIGSGKEDALKKIEKTMLEIPNNLNIIQKGYIPYTELKQYYQESNIGISYIPKTSWYLLQPPTKTYEYLRAGMIVIATELPGNEEVINNNNGIIIQDNPESFAEGVQLIYENIGRYNMQYIKESSKQFSWKIIIEETLTNALEKIKYSNN